MTVSHRFVIITAIFITCLLDGQSPTVYGDGEQSRDFTYVDNVVQANLLAADAADASGGVFNVGCGERYTLNQLLEMLGDLLDADPQAEYGPERPGDVKHSKADISRAREILGYDPEVGFREGLARTVQSFVDD
jgi:nucleoside-diphosphate-sugar epimerase